MNSVTRPYAITRRSFLTAAAAAAVATRFAPLSLFAQTAAPADVVSQSRDAAASAKITVTPLRRNVSVLMGSGGNIAVFPGKDGKLLVDSGFSSSRPQITEALTGISADPIKHLVDTHWHFDHTDGNAWIHDAGATIIAHENTRLRLSTPQFMVAFNVHLAPSPAGALPTTVFGADHTLNTNGATIKLTHYAPAHTDSDISVHFVEADVLHCGDTFFNGVFPFIDYSSGGNINGMIAATARNLATATGNTILIPGHGPIGTRTQLAAYHDMLRDIHDKVTTLKQQGKTIDEVVAAKPTATYDAKWGAGFVNPETFTKLVYQGV